MAKRTTITQRRKLLLAAGESLADLVSDPTEAPDPAVAAYHRLRVAANAEPYDGANVDAAENTLVATRASSHAGVGAKLVELATHEGWLATPDHYQTRLIHSALADLKGLEGRS